jgi:hypothetical protein
MYDVIPLPPSLAGGAHDRLALQRNPNRVSLVADMLCGASGTVGAAPYRKELSRVRDWPSGFVTVTSYRPADFAAVTAVSDWPLPATTTFVAAVPAMLTVIPLTKPVPETVIVVPPTTGPAAGDTPLNVGREASV